eukprot:GGOE01014591.1.p1 GENE.GGOE01014591.1~~GGOE01014591.1.p1  ORF type:complete len:265 (-),score=68.13 GGOE01014591.1:253-1047(-)
MHKRQLWLILVPIPFIWLIGLILFFYAPHADIDSFDTTSDIRLYGLVNIDGPEAGVLGKGVASVNVSKRSPAALLYLQAQRELALGRPNSALGMLSRAIEEDPANPTILAKRAIVRMSRSNTSTGAIDDLISSIQLDPDNPILHYDLAVIRHRALDIDAALADYSEAINVLPSFQQAYNNRGVVFKDMAYYSAALDDYDRAIRLAPNASFPYFNRAVLRSQLKEYSGAMEDFDMYIRLQPQDASAIEKRRIIAKRVGVGFQVGH